MRTWPGSSSSGKEHSASGLLPVRDQLTEAPQKGRSKAKSLKGARYIN